MFIFNMPEMVSVKTQERQCLYRPIGIVGRSFKAFCRKSLERTLEDGFFSKLAGDNKGKGIAPVFRQRLGQFYRVRKVRGKNLVRQFQDKAGI